MNAFKESRFCGRVLNIEGKDRFQNGIYISWGHNEKRRFGEFDTRRIDRRQEA